MAGAVSICKPLISAALTVWVLVAALAGSPAAAAQTPQGEEPTPTAPGGGGGLADTGTTISHGEDVEIPGDLSEGTFAAAVDAERPHPKVGNALPPCGAREIVYYDADGEIQFWPPGQGPCLERLACGAERVDDFFNGRLATPEASSAELARYLTDFFTDALPTNLDIDATAHATSLVGVALGEQPAETSLPVFNWCRRPSTNEYTTIGVHRTNFTWSTTIDAEYDIPSVQNDLLARIEAQLAITNPTIASAPDASLGYTWVKFPTWLWVDNASHELTTSATNAHVDNIRLSIRARLVQANFTINNTTLTCTVDELIAYVDGDTDPIDDLGPCHHVQNTTGDLNIEADLDYTIEVRRQQRLHRSQPWPNTTWRPHPTRANVTIPLPQNLYNVREILALNTNG